MINTILKNNDKHQITIDNVINDIYLLPKWEKLKSFCINEKGILFLKKNTINIDLYRKFSAKNSIEKYALKNFEKEVIGNMDLKVYKDSVYIINFNINNLNNFEDIAIKLLQVAIEKSLYNTTEKEVFINVSSDIFSKLKLKKLLANNDFKMSENQSKYEKEMFGETYYIKAENSSLWNSRIKQQSILINK